MSAPAPADEYVLASMEAVRASLAAHVEKVGAAGLTPEQGVSAVLLGVIEPPHPSAPMPAWWLDHETVPLGPTFWSAWRGVPIMLWR